MGAVRARGRVLPCAGAFAWSCDRALTVAVRRCGGL